MTRTEERLADAAGDVGDAEAGEEMVVVPEVVRREGDRHVDDERLPSGESVRTSVRSFSMVGFRIHFRCEAGPFLRLLFEWRLWVLGARISDRLSRLA